MATSTAIESGTTAGTYSEQEQQQHYQELDDSSVHFVANIFHRELPEIPSQDTQPQQEPDSVDYQSVGEPFCPGSRQNADADDAQAHTTYAVVDQSSE